MMVTIKSLGAIALIGLAAVGVAQTSPGARQKLAQQIKEAKKVAWSQAAGRPKIGPNSPGIYIWHEGNRFHLVSFNDKAMGGNLGGAVSVRGKDARLFDIDPIRNEKADRIGRKKNTVQFRFDTKKESDGVEFSLAKGKLLIVRLNQPGQADRKVFVGGKETQVVGGLVVFDLKK